MAHIRRKFVDVHKAQGSAIAEEAIKRIAGLYAIEKEARGSPPDQRTAIRQAEARPVFDDLGNWLGAQIVDLEMAMFKCGRAGHQRYCFGAPRTTSSLDHRQAAKPQPSPIR